VRVFVTGGNGFIGSATVRALVGRGDDVVCLLRRNSRTERVDMFGVRRVVGDVGDVSALRIGMTGCDATVHLAAPGGWGDEDPRRLREVIEEGTRNVLSVALTMPNHRVIYVSSTAAIAASDEPQVFDEGAEFNIRTPELYYAHAKHRAEGLVREAVARGLDAVIVNPAEVYGPDDNRLGTARNLLDFGKSWPVLVCHGGTAVVHVEDVASGILAALARGRPGERYILAGENVTIRGLAELVIAKLGRRVPIVTAPRWLARGTARLSARLRIPLPFDPHVVGYATRFWFVSNAKARAELGVDFRDARPTVDSTVAWLIVAGHLRAGSRTAG